MNPPLYCYIDYVDRDGADGVLSFFPPGLKTALLSTLCPTPVYIFSDSNQTVVEVETHCHCPSSIKVHPLYCIAWQVYVRNRCAQAYRNVSRSVR